MPSIVSIRSEQPQDQSGVHALHAACFPTDAEARLVDALRTAGRLAVSLVALDDNQVIGHVAFSPVTVATGQSGLGLAPVAVHSEYRQRGIAAELIRLGHAACAQQGIGWTVVLGDPAYYGRFGYRPAREYGLTDSYGGGDAFQVLELRPDAAPRNAGLVRYAPEFAVLG